MLSLALQHRQRVPPLALTYSSLSLSPAPSSCMSADAIPNPISPAASMDMAGSAADLSACARSDGSIRKWPSPALIEVSAWL